MSQYPSVRKPTFATSATGLANTVDPGVTKQSDGWAANERPPAEFFNWLGNAKGQWIDYLHGTATEIRNALGSTDGNHVVAGLIPSISGTTVSVAPGSAILLETSPASGEPTYNPSWSGATLTATVPSISTWYGVFGQRNATTSAFEIVAVAGSSTLIPTPGVEQVPIAVCRNGILWDARKFSRVDLRDLRSMDAHYHKTNVKTSTTVGSELVIDADVDYKLGTYGRNLRYYGTADAGASLNVGTGSSTFAADTIYYVYLFAADIAALALSNGNNSGVILTTATPNVGERVITHTPLAGSQLNTGHAVLIGAVLRNSANTGFASWVTSGDGRVSCNTPIQFTGSSISPTGSGTASVSLGSMGIPAKSYTVDVFGYLGLPSAAVVTTTPTALPGNGPLESRAQYMPVGTSNLRVVESHVMGTSTDSVSVAYSGFPASCTGSFGILLRGFTF